MRFQIDEDRAIGSAPLKGKIIHPKQARRWHEGGASPLRSPRERISTDRHAHAGGKPCAGLTTHGDGYQVQHDPQASRAPGLNRDHGWQAFHKGLPLTLTILTPKASHMQLQLDML